MSDARLQMLVATSSIPTSCSRILGGMRRVIRYRAFQKLKSLAEGARIGCETHFWYVWALVFQRRYGYGLQQHQGLALAIAVWGMKKNILQMLLGSQLTLPDGVWMRLNQAWIAYCAFMSAVNAYVVMNFSTEFWVDFKLWGYAFPLVFLVGQGLYIAPHIKGDEPAR